MSHVLTKEEESPLVVPPTLASKIGLKKAIFVQQIHFWLQRSEHVGKGDLRPKRTWVHKSLREWTEELPFMSRSTIHRIKGDLEEDGYLLTETGQEKPNPRTWYSLRYRKIYALYVSAAPASEGVSQYGTGGVPIWNTVSQSETPVSQSETPARAHNAGARSIEYNKDYNIDKDVVGSSARKRARGDGSKGSPPQVDQENEPTGADENPFSGEAPQYVRDDPLVDKMEETYDRYRPADVMEMAKHLWRTDDHRSRPSNVDSSTVTRHKKEHPWEAVVAAYVMAQRADSSPQLYAASLLDEKTFYERTEPHAGSESAGSGGEDSRTDLDSPQRKRDTEPSAPGGARADRGGRW
jgi:hypothetical protein